MSTILENVRLALGLDDTDTSFDAELLLHINSAVGTLSQVSPVRPIQVDSSTQWNDVRLIEDTSKTLFESVKHYVFLRVKLLFDPPPPNSAMYMDKILEETLWRIREHSNEEDGI